MANPATVAPALFNLTSYMKGDVVTRHVLTTPCSEHAFDHAKTWRAETVIVKRGKRKVTERVWNVTVSRSFCRKPSGKVTMLWTVSAVRRVPTDKAILALTGAR